MKTKLSTDILANTAAEEAALGSLLIDPSFAASHIRRCVPEDFTDPKRKALVAAFLATGAVDVVELTTAASQISKLPDDQLLTYSLELVQAVPSAIKVEAYVNLVIEAAEKRRGLEVLSKAGASLVQGQPWDVVRQHVTGQLRESRTAAQERDMATVIEDLYQSVGEWVENPLDADQVRWQTTGLRNLDKLTGGLQPALYLSGARPSVGKTALWGQVAVNVAWALGPGSGRRVLYFTNEMTDTQLAMRLACAKSGVSKLALEQGRLGADDLAALYDALDYLRRLPLRLIYARNLTDIMARCYQEEAPALIVVDYLNKMGGGEGENRNQLYGNIAGTLFDMAYDLKTPVVLLCQLNRDLEKRGKDALPEMADLRDSGELEQIADVILLLHRDPEVDPGALRVLKRKDRLGGGQHSGTSLYFDRFTSVKDGAYGHQNQ